MAKRKTTRKKPKAKTRIRPMRWLLGWAMRIGLVAVVIVVLVIIAHAILKPPKSFYMRQEAQRLGEIKYDWVSFEDIAPVMARSVVAAEDANFCNHWGFDMAAIRIAIEQGGGRGASTISQQVVKNVYLWHGRSYLRKALEALITPVMEMIWTKRRVVEVYLNVAEFDEGVFGIKAASQHYFGVKPSQLTPVQSARLAAVLPNPKERSASRPTSRLRKRAASIMDGAATIKRDGRASCFED